MVAFVKQSHVPGLAVGVVVDGRLAYFKGFGVRDVASGAPVDEETVFRIASMTKSFVSASVLRLRDEGKLSLDDPAEKYLPELKALRYPTRDSPRLTVRHLLSHSAGLPEDNATADLRMPMADAEFDALLSHGLSFSTAPGTRYEYANLGFALAGRLVTRVSGERLQDYVSRHLLAPLGMSATGWDGAAVPEAHRAHGYGRKGSNMPSAGLARYQDDAPHEEPMLADGAWAPIGGLWTSPRDYARWVAFQLSATPPRDDPDDGPVRRASLRESQSVQRAYDFDAALDPQGQLRVSAGGYGLGWGIGDNCSFETHVVTHGGGLPGYGSVVMLAPETGVGAFAMTNLTYTGASKLVRELLGSLQEQGLLPSRPQPPAPQLERARDEVTALMMQWDAPRAAALFDALHASYEPPAKLRERLEKMHAVHGACRAGAAIEPENRLRGTALLACDRGGLALGLELTSDAPPRIQALVMDSILPPSPALAALAARAVPLLARWDDGEAARAFEDDARDNARSLFRTVRATPGACRAGVAVRTAFPEIFGC